MSRTFGESKGARPVKVLVGLIRLLVSLYIVILGVLMMVSALAHLSIGRIIGGVHVLSASICLLGLELDFIHFPALDDDDAHLARSIGLQFSAAVLVGMSQDDMGFFFLGCIAFGITVGLVHFGGINMLVSRVGVTFNGSAREAAEQPYVDAESVAKVAALEREHDAPYRR
ncbi:hypothetical protein RhiJN_24024 [Ceratobasidium sp. AG-Ba]|nr:hypothetical protein RhiJN_24024 [Ceratobasidium sp. AG-Ba]